MLNKHGYEPTNKNFRNTAYIIYKKKYAKKAIKKAHETEFLGRIIRVQLSNKKPSSNVSIGSIAYFIGNLSYNARKKDIEKLFSSCGTILSIRLAPLLQNNDDDDDENESANIIEDKQQEIDYNQPEYNNRKGYISGKDGSHGGYCWIIFKETEVNEKQVLNLNNTILCGRKIRVNIARLKDKTSKTVHKLKNKL